MSTTGEEGDLLPDLMLDALEINPHRLTSLDEGQSEVERLAAKIERRRDERLLVTSEAQVRLLTRCREIAMRQGYNSINQVSRDDLAALRRDTRSIVEQEHWRPFYGVLGVKTTNQNLLETLDRALLHVDRTQDWFHYQEFIFFHTMPVSKWPWMRNESMNAFFVVLLFFLATPVLFCQVLEDRNICEDPRSPGISWLNGCYMASVTLSTVGYGDVTVEKTNIHIGTLYMIASICVSILAFGAAADDAFSPLERFYEKYLSIDETEVAEGEILSTKLRRVKLLKIGEIVVHFVFLNMIGVIVSRFFQGNLSKVEEGSQWTWGESIYWSVQSTTTIGYGDMIMSPEMRFFQIFYLCLGTFFVGNTLGKLSNLKDDMESLRRLYAWEQREVSKEMIRTDQGASDDPRVDQFEFVVASLLNLGKISSDDIKPIMGKFRRLATASGDRGYIDLGSTRNANIYRYERDGTIHKNDELIPPSYQKS